MLTLTNLRSCFATLLVTGHCLTTVPAHAFADKGDGKPLSEVTIPVSTESYEATEPEQIFTATELDVNPPVESDNAAIYILPPIDITTEPQPANASSDDLTVDSAHKESGITISINPDDDDDEEKTPLNFLQLLSDPYVSYRSKQSNISWLPGSGQDFGFVEWDTEAYLDRGESSGFTGAMNMTWLSGPRSTALPARVYEISAGFQTRKQWSPGFSYDLATSIGIFSDFEGSAREGVRFPSHAVGMFHVNNSTDIVFGADFFDRDDISVLPVFGLSFRSPQHSRLRFDLIFPRPRIEYSFSNSKRMFVTGSMGGGTWDVDDGIDHIATYRDYRVMLGFEKADDDGETSAIEFGYVFGRQMELRGQSGQTDFDDAFMIRWVTRH